MTVFFTGLSLLLLGLFCAPALAAERGRALEDPARTEFIMNSKKDCLLEIFKDPENQPADARAAIDSCLLAKGLTEREIVRGQDAAAAEPLAPEPAPASASVTSGEGIYRPKVATPEVANENAGSGAASVSGTPPAKGTIYRPLKNKEDGGAKPIFLNR